MTTWHELIDLRRFEALMRGLAIGLPLLGLLSGAVVGAASKTLKTSLIRGLSVGLLGPLAYGLWRLFAYLVRYDPLTGYCGLHRVSVLLLNVVIFAVAGVVLGVLYGRLWRATAPPSPPTADGAGP